ncbi:cytochrome c-type biogenesis protein CcmH [Vibrio cholerae]|nr:cytochrome c-type biogenesis protein CcmH [Vibrio cholerae]
MDDNNSMMEGSKLSSLESYVVRVRIDSAAAIHTFFSWVQQCT